jgi:hypothetical protein
MADSIGASGPANVTDKIAVTVPLPPIRGRLRIVLERTAIKFEPIAPDSSSIGS